MQNLFQDLSKKGLSTKKFQQVIVKAFFINISNESCLNPTLILKILFSCQLLNRPKLYLFSNNIYYKKMLLAFEKSTKQTKTISVAVQHFEIFGIYLF